MENGIRHQRLILHAQTQLANRLWKCIIPPRMFSSLIICYRPITPYFLLIHIPSVLCSFLSFLILFIFSFLSFFPLFFSFSFVFTLSVGVVIYFHEFFKKQNENSLSFSSDSFLFYFVIFREKRNGRFYKKGIVFFSWIATNLFISLYIY